MGHSATSKDASSWLLPALCSELTRQFIDSVLASVCLRGFPHVSQDTHRVNLNAMNEIIVPLIIRTREGGGSDVFDLTVRVGRHHGEDQCDPG